MSSKQLNDNRQWDEIDDFLNVEVKEGCFPSGGIGSTLGKGRRSKYHAEHITDGQLKTLLNAQYPGFGLMLNDFSYPCGIHPHNWPEHLLFIHCAGGEARNQENKGIEEVAKVIMRRLQAQTYFGKNLRDIMLKGCGKAETAHFTSEWPGSPTFFWHKKESSLVWSKLVILVMPIFFGIKQLDNPKVLHYTRKDITPPSWTKKLKEAYVIGDHIFYDGM